LLHCLIKIGASFRTEEEHPGAILIRGNNNQLHTACHPQFQPETSKQKSGLTSTVKFFSDSGLQIYKSQAAKHGFANYLSILMIHVPFNLF